MEQLTYWQSLAVAADRNQLFLDPEVAQACSRSCDAYIEKLVGHQASAKELANTTGWGDFDMGKAIQKIFSEKAVGGENNMVDVLDSHIEVVRQMQAVFQKFFADTTAQDEANAAGFEGPR